MEKEILQEMTESINKFESDLKIPVGFYNKLLDEDDWSFIIKISAFLETASTDVLATVLGYKEIENALSYLDYGNGKCGKIVLMEKLGIVSKSQASTLRKFLEIRNSVAHRLENINFTFDSYIKEFDKTKKKNFVKDFGISIKDEFEFLNSKIQKCDFVLDNPKMCIWINIKEIIACMHVSKEQKEIQNELTFILTPTMASNLFKELKS